MSLAHGLPDQVGRFLAAQPIAVQLLWLSGPLLTESIIEVLGTGSPDSVGLIVIAFGRPRAVADLAAALRSETSPSAREEPSSTPGVSPPWPRPQAGDGTRTERATRRAGWDRLTEREQTIARLASQALTNKEIAKRLFVSPHTVNYHLRQIYRKLRIRSRVHLAQVVPHRTAEDQ